jgi:hypothetical protein
VRSAGVARFGGLETCGSVWACPVCSAQILAQRGNDLTTALERWHAQGGAVAMVTLTMRHSRRHSLAECWDALSDGWAAASGSSRGARAAKQAAGVEGWVRRVEVTWGADNGWHVHIHALLFLTNPGAVTALGDAMFDGWSARLARVGMTPIRDSGGLDCRVLSMEQARAEVAGYVTKGGYAEQIKRAAMELTGSGKLGRGQNLTQWGLLDAARAGDRHALALWVEWERTSHGRRALTWSRNIRAKLGLGAELDDDDLVDEPGVDVETVAIWTRAEWPAIRDLPPRMFEQLLSMAAGIEDLADAFNHVHMYAQIFRVPLPRPGPAVPAELIW